MCAFFLRFADLWRGIVLSGKKCLLKEVRVCARLGSSFICSLIGARHQRRSHSPTQPMCSQKNGMKDAPRCATFLYFPFLFISLALPLPPSPCLCLPPLLAALSSPPCPAPSDVAPTTREDGGARQQLLGDVVHVWCVRHTDECTLALHTTGESPIGGMLAQLLVILATAVT